MTDYKIRTETERDIDFLWEMLYQAIFVAEGEIKPSREILNQPEIFKYLCNWGRQGDIALIATDSSENPVGAIWIRLFDESNKTYGFIDKNTPVLSMAVVPEYRGKGVGTLLLNEMLRIAKDSGFFSLSLSVDPKNPALHLYERHGFVKVGINGTSWDMMTTLDNKYKIEGLR
ncbi:GNAT family N-acetyltransferase [Cytobacillus praedii]|uniref:GNAT family N-acetyltransferase n=1 Tax=Cytobacillus praedii TaxID=1742358 RepID=UPI002E1BDED8|nr:GNAT family N-acetyltransferase [Cytobacillus praedii]